MDRIFSSNPLNATAAKVTGRGIHWNPETKCHAAHAHHTAPPQTIPVTHYYGRDGFEDLTGREFGRFTVVGFLGKRNPKEKALWLVRCSCGDFEERKASAIKKAHPNSMCINCGYLERVKRAYREPIG